MAKGKFNLNIMQVVLTRHGQTEENIAGILQGHLPGVLSDLGKEQAQKLARRLREESFAAIYSSDLERAADTAGFVAKFHPHTPLVFIPELRERYLGEYQGRIKAEVGWDQNLPQDQIVMPSDGENDLAMYLRAEKLLQDLYLKHGEERILLVCHADISRFLTAVMSNLSLAEMAEVRGLRNTAVSEFDYHPFNSRVLYLNDVQHLE